MKSFKLKIHLSHYANFNKQYPTKQSLRPDLSGALFARRDPSTSSGQAYKKAGTEGGNEIKAKALLEVYERSSRRPNK